MRPNSKKMFKKTAYILLSYYLILIVSACCNCKENRSPFYSYNKIEAKTLTSNNPEIKGVAFTLTFLDSSFRVTAQKPAFGLMNSAMAFQPCDCDLIVRPKFKIEQLKIYEIIENRKIDRTLEFVTDGEFLKKELIKGVETINNIEFFRFISPPTMVVYLTTEQIQKGKFLIEAKLSNGSLISTYHEIK